MKLLGFFLIFGITSAPYAAKAYVENKLSNDMPERFPATLHLSTRTTNSIINTNNLKQLNPELPIKFIIHGWTQHSDAAEYVTMKDRYLETYDANIIRVNWSELAAGSYLDAANAVREVGKYLGEFISHLHHTHNIPLSNIHIIGHSLGGQVAGFLGRAVKILTGSQVARITALDPAKPNFEAAYVKDEDRLTLKDAKLVDIIHTDAGIFGYSNAAGTVDFYPNGGLNQPGCKTRQDSLFNTLIMGFTFQGWAINDWFCSHHASVIFFTKSITAEDILAVQCDSWDHYKRGNCNNNTAIVFGEHMKSDVKGTYFFIM